jgi:hypothetical protein
MPPNEAAATALKEMTEPSESSGVAGGGAAGADTSAAQGKGADGEAASSAIPTQPTLIVQFQDLQSIDLGVAVFANSIVDAKHLRGGHSSSNSIKPRMRVVRAKYGSSGKEKDYTAAVQALIGEDQRLVVHGGIHTAIGDPEHGIPKVFIVEYFAEAP